MKKKKRDKCSQNPPALFQSRHLTLISPPHTCHMSLWGCPRHISRPWLCTCVSFSVFSICRVQKRVCLCGFSVSICRMSAWVHAYVLAYHKICKNNAITLTVQQFSFRTTAVQKSKIQREIYSLLCIKLQNFKSKKPVILEIGCIWVLSILKILCGSVWFDVFLPLVSIISAWGLFWCAKRFEYFLLLFSF